MDNNTNNNNEVQEEEETTIDEEEAEDTNQEQETTTHQHVASQVRKRISSLSRFRPDDNEDDDDEQFHDVSSQNQNNNNNNNNNVMLSNNNNQTSSSSLAAVANNNSFTHKHKRTPSLPQTLSNIAYEKNLATKEPLVSQHQDPNNNNKSENDSSSSEKKNISSPDAKNPEKNDTNKNILSTTTKTTGEEKQEHHQEKEKEKEQQQQQEQEQDQIGASSHLTQPQEQERWRLRRKHIFIFSDAGKPVFTRWGDESDFAELFGIFQVLMEMSISNGLGALKHVCLGSHDVHFFSDEHLRFVMVTATQEPADTCQHQLRLLNHCLLSGFPTVNRILDRNSGYDVRNQLLHPEVFRSLVKSMNHEVPMIFQGIDCGFFDPVLRSKMNECLRKDGFAGYDSSDDGGGHLMSLIVCRGKILAWGQIPNFQLSTDDLLLLIHFSERCCGTMSSLDNTWAPLCLPDYDKEGSFWVHAMQLSNDEPTSASLDSSNNNKAAAASSATKSDGSQQNLSQQQNITSSSTSTSSSIPILIQLATHTEVISSLKVSAQRVKQTLSPILEKMSKASGKVMSLPYEWQQLGVMHCLFNRWGVLAYTAPPVHAQERKHRKNFFRSLLQVRAEALTLSKTARPFLMRATPFETICFSRKIVKFKSASMGRASAELFVTFLPGTDAGSISSAVNRIWDTMLNKDAWAQFVAARCNFSLQ